MVSYDVKVKSATFQLDQVVLKAHKGYVASEFAGEDLLNLKTALQSIDDCLDVRNLSIYLFGIF